MRLSFVILLTVLACFASADWLNITTCYCHQNWETIDQPYTTTNTGIFYGFDYWNRHLDRNFTMNLTERFEGDIDPAADPSPPPSPIMKPICASFEGSHGLCYWRSGYHRHARIAFNGHVHLISRKRNRKHERQLWSYPRCQERCLSEFGFLEMDAKRSTFGMWPEVDDVCEIAPTGGCAWIHKDKIGDD